MTDEIDPTAKYNTGLPPEQEQGFQSWVADQSAKTGRNVANDNYDYDLRGWYAKNGAQDLTGAHLTDEFKKPNHPTFSQDSQYHGVDGNEGGRWDKRDNGSWSFTPGRTNMENFSQPEMRNYFQQVEKGNELIAPDADQAQQAREAAALRLQQSGLHPNTPFGGSDIGNQLTLDAVDNLTGAVSVSRGVHKIMGGDMGGAMDVALGAMPWLARVPGFAEMAGRAVKRLAPAAATGGAGAALLLPTNNTAEAQEKANFDFIPDAKDRAAALATYNSTVEYLTNPKTGRTRHDSKGEPVVDEAATAKSRAALMNDMRKEAAAKTGATEKEQSERSLAGQSLADFEDKNKPALGLLTPEQRGAYNALTVPNNIPATISARGEYLQQQMQEREKKGRSFVELAPWYPYVAEGAAGIVGAFLGARGAVKDAATFRNLAEGGEKALESTAQKAVSTRATVQQKLQENVGSWQRNALGRLGHMAGSGILPAFMGVTIPDTIDAVRFKDHPDYPAYQHAVKELIPFTPEFNQAVGRTFSEGAGSEFLGHMVGAKLSGMSEARKNASAVLKVLQDRKAAEGVADKVIGEANAHADRIRQEAEAEAARLRATAAPAAKPRASRKQPAAQPPNGAGSSAKNLQ